MIVNLDIVIAGETATFGFPEVKRGVSISAGGLPRFARLVGHQKGMQGASRYCQADCLIFISLRVHAHRSKHPRRRSENPANDQRGRRERSSRGKGFGSRETNRIEQSGLPYLLTAW